MKQNDNSGVLRTLQKAHATIETLRRKLAASSARAHAEPIAIVGMGCRFPGGANDPETFFRHLLDGVDAIADMPKTRTWMRRRRSGPAWGGWLDDIEGFDADFFGLAPVEARCIDPQQRLLLEVAWEALENAGIAPNRLTGSETGVFVGMYGHDYEGLLLGNPDRFVSDIYARTGNGGSFAAGRLSYHLGLQGPCLSVDTACSSSLTALHLACRALVNRECSTAICGGVNVIMSAAAAEWLDHSPGLAPDGRCRSFDAAASGFVRAEGCGVVVLKRLSVAQADGDRIWAVIRGSAVNQDGRSAGFTAPNAAAQRAAITAALTEAEVDAADVGYIETHGSGTPLGDPVEVEALRATYGKASGGASACVLGAVKTHIGHLEAAAGIAGLIKATLVLDRGRVPRNLHFRVPNPHLEIDGTRLAFAAQPMSFPEGADRRIAAVSAFGMGGSNAHAIVEQAPDLEAPAQEEDDLQASDPRPYLFAASAKSEAGLREGIQRLAAHLETTRDSTRDVAYTSCSRGTHLSRRALVVASDAAQAAQELRAIAGRPELPAPRAGAAGPVFVFSGHGSQWPSMAADLLAAESVFRESVEACDAEIKRCSGWSLLHTLEHDPSRIESGDNAIVQPTLFSISVGLAALWRSWGIEPSAVVGHSMGEIAAAHVAGVLDLADAVRVVCKRSEVLAQALGKGGMLLAELPLTAARERIEGLTDEISIAVNNSPNSCVLSGHLGRLTEIATGLERDGIFHRFVKVDYASHSPQMEPLRPALMEALSGIAPRQAMIPFHSTLTGALMSGTECDAGYWYRNLREPVLFADVIRQELALGRSSFIELSPHPLLLASIEQNVTAAQPAPVVVASLQRGRPSLSALYASLAELYMAGHDPDWSCIQRAGGRVVSLPTRAWQRSRHWAPDEWQLQSPDERAQRSSDGATVSEDGPHEKGRLGSRLAVHADRPGRIVWQTEIASPHREPGLCEHRWGIATLGASLWLAMARDALSEMETPVVDGALCLLESSVVLAAGSLQTIAERDAEGISIRCYHREDPAASFVQVGEARFRVTSVASPDMAVSAGRELSDWQASALLQDAGVDPLVAPLRGVEVGSGGARARLCVAPDAECSAALLLCAVERLATLMTVAGRPSAVALRVHRWEALVHGGPLTGELQLSLRAVAHADCTVGELCVADASGRQLLFAKGLRLCPVAYRELGELGADPVANRLYSLQWRDSQSADIAPAQGEGCLVIGPHGDARLTRMVDGLRGLGIDCVPLPDDEATLSQLSARLESGRFAHVVYCAGLHEGNGFARAGAVQATALRIIALVRLLTELAEPSRLWLVTRGAVAATAAPEPVDPFAASVWGLGRVIALEHAALWGGLLDLESDADTSDALALSSMLFASDGEDQIAWRSGQRLVLRLCHDDLPGPASIRLRADRSYLVTGGLGGLGLKLARFLCAAGARHLVLLGRSPLPDPACADEELSAEQRRRRDAVRGLQAQGARIDVAAVDVADRAQLQPLLSSLGSSLAGVFHVAGIGDMRPLAEIDDAHLAEVFRPKVEGAFLLHELTQDYKLDHFVLFSSIAAVWGGRWEAHYAAANAFLDGLAHLRKARGLPAVSVNWGYWASPEGMGNAYTDNLVRGVGTTPLPSELAFDAFARIISRGETQRTVACIDWSVFEPVFHARRRRHLLDSIVDAPLPSAESGILESPQGDLRSELAALSPAAAREALRTLIRKELRRVLGLPLSQPLDPDRGFTDAGMDSITAVRLGKALEAKLGATVPTVALFEHPNIRALAVHLEGQVLGLAEPSDQAEVPADEGGIDDLLGRLTRKLDGRT